MSEVQSKSPPDLSFAPRQPEFDLAAALGRDWCGGSAFRTAWFNALSMLFPLGEKFFIDSVRAFRDQIDDPVLVEQITAFQGQEAVHRRQHQRYNEILCRARGYDHDAIEKIVAAARKHGRALAVLSNAEVAPLRLKQGFQMVSVSTDSNALVAGSAASLAAVRERVAGGGVRC